MGKRFFLLLLLLTSLNNVILYPKFYHTGTTNIPVSFFLYQNYPNPFNPSTKIKFDIPGIPLSREVPEGRGVLTSLKIYNILGREVATLVNEILSPGTYDVEWDATNYPSGTYFYQLKTENFTPSKKLILLK